MRPKTASRPRLAALPLAVLAMALAPHGTGAAPPAKARATARVVDTRAKVPPPFVTVPANPDTGPADAPYFGSRMVPGRDADRLTMGRPVVEAGAGGTGLTASPPPPLGAAAAPPAPAAAMAPSGLSPAPMPMPAPAPAPSAEPTTTTVTTTTTTVTPAPAAPPPPPPPAGDSGFFTSPGLAPAPDPQVHGRRDRGPAEPAPAWLMASASGGSFVYARGRDGGRLVPTAARRKVLYVPDARHPAAGATPTPLPRTPAGADAFVDRFNADRRRDYPLETAAQWLQSTDITDDSQAMASFFNERGLAYAGQAAQGARAFDGVPGLSPATARALMLMQLPSPAPAPADPARREELAKLLSRMEANYGAAKWCRTPTECLTLPEIEKILGDPTATPAARAEAWAGWHATARPILADYQRFVVLANTGARELGYANLAQGWQAGYDMPPAAFEAETARLWAQVKPFYEQLHCYVRAKLNAKYGDAVVPPHGPIPAHLLGNMWAQQWGDIYPEVEPFPGVGSLDVTPALKARRDEIARRLAAEAQARQPGRALTVGQQADLEHAADLESAKAMTRTAEDFYVSLGMQKLPAAFWEKSLLVKPRDREVVCHASAWDMNYQGSDVRVKQCLEPTEEQLFTIHHELGHIYYDLNYSPLPPVFQDAAHDGFHEAIGDTVTLSLTPRHLAKIGLVPASAVATDDRALINAQMKLALAKIAFLPFGKMIDEWRWRVFDGRIAPGAYNTGWWQLREAYQGVSAPVPRTDADFDAGAKYHVPGNTPYTRYFLSFILQFQFHQALCQAAGQGTDLAHCDIYGSKAAGQKYMAMLAAGRSAPWPDTLEKLTGTRRMDASAIIGYFRPLMTWLEAQNQGRTCGWAPSHDVLAGR